MGLNREVRVIVILAFLGIYPFIANALWSGPNEIVQGTWGTSDVQFGFQSGEIKDQYPEKIQILSDGKIIVEDWVNTRIKIYQPNGVYLKSIEQLGLGLYELDADKIISFSWDDAVKNERIGVFSLMQGNWIWMDKKRVFDSARVSVKVFENNIYVWDGKQIGYQYSGTGQLIKIYNEEPAEFGQVREVPIGGGKYKIEIKYPDKTYTLSAPVTYMKYARDASGHIHAVNPGGVWRFDQCGKQIGELLMPKQGTEPVPVPGTEKYINIKVVYGEPVIAPSGDVYAWKKTDFKYSILKWTWVDDPNTPPCPDEKGAASKREK